MDVGRRLDLLDDDRAFMAGDRAATADLLSAARIAAGAGVLKVILETGALADPVLIRAAADLALAHGADFLKTSTGKIAAGATPKAANVSFRIWKRRMKCPPVMRCGRCASGSVLPL